MESAFDHILLLDKDLFGLRLRALPELEKLLEWALAQGSYRDISLFGKMKDGRFHKLHPHHLPELISLPAGDVELYGEGPAVFCLLRDILRELEEEVGDKKFNQRLSAS